MTQVEVARELGVSSRMIRHVIAGTKGANLTGALEQLATRGRVSEPPPRRTQRVRAPGGTTRQVTAAAPPSGPRRFGVETTYTRGGKLVAMSIPRSEGVGRQTARQAITDELYRGVHGRRERLRFTVRLANGRTVRWAQHGQSARAAARSARLTYGGDGLGWLAGQFAGSTYEDEVGDDARNVVGLELEWF